MKKKYGFTLPELLLTMGIIGIIAAITIPQIVNTIKNQAIQPAVERAKNLLEESMTNIIHKAQYTSNATTLAAIQVKDVIDGNDSTYLTAKSGNDEALFDKLSGFIGIDSITNYTNIAGNSAKTYKLKRANSCIIVVPIDDSKVTINIKDDSILTNIYIDADCSRGKNEIDNDIFLYGLSNNGKLIKSGNTAYTNKKIF